MFVKNLTKEVITFKKDGKTLILKPGVNCVDTVKFNIEDLKRTYGPQHLVFIDGTEEQQVQKTDEAPVVDTPVDVAPVDAPVVDTPADKTPADKTPAVDTPVVDTPVVDTPVVDTPAKEEKAKTGKTKAGKAKAGK